jgi:hypothetical protein
MFTTEEPKDNAPLEARGKETPRPGRGERRRRDSRRRVKTNPRGREIHRTKSVRCKTVPHFEDSVRNDGVGWTGGMVPRSLRYVPQKSRHSGRDDRSGKGEAKRRGQTADPSTPAKRTGRTNRAPRSDAPQIGAKERIEPLRSLRGSPLEWGKQGKRSASCDDPRKSRFLGQTPPSE